MVQIENIFLRLTTIILLISIARNVIVSTFTELGKLSHEVHFSLIFAIFRLQSSSVFAMIMK